jgi:hypothetical protein
MIFIIHAWNTEHLARLLMSAVNEEDAINRLPEWCESYQIKEANVTNFALPLGIICELMMIEEEEE